MSTLSSQVQIATMTANRHSRDIEDEYQRALDFLAANEPEQCLRINLPFDKFEALERYASNLYGDKKYPYVDYCSTTSTAIIYTVPTPLQWQVSSQLQYLIQRSVERELMRHNKSELARKVQASGESSDRPIFGGYNRRISKTPDGGLVYVVNNKDVLTVVIETGLSENYEKLQKDVTLWLDGMHCNTAILICLQEQPKFKYPPKNEHRFTLESYDVFQDVMAETSAETPFGPYIYDGHTWFGHLAEAFAEVFKRDEGGTIQRQTYWLIRDRKFLIQDEEFDIGLTIGDVIPAEEAAADDIRSGATIFSTEDIKDVLISGARRTASVRFRA
ncbi:hypothetical protein V1522DRAFT_429380 [Lipomyces starkeyi]